MIWNLPFPPVGEGLDPPESDVGEISCADACHVWFY